MFSRKSLIILMSSGSSFPFSQSFIFPYYSFISK